MDNAKDLALLQEGMKRRCPFQKYIIAFVSEFRSLSPETIGRGLLVPTREIRRPTRSHGRGILKKRFCSKYESQSRQENLVYIKAVSNNLIISPLLRFQLLPERMVIEFLANILLVQGVPEEKLCFKIH